MGRQSIRYARMHKAKTKYMICLYAQSEDKDKDNITEIHI